MIDLIIPAYNAHNTIVKTLASVRLQTFRDNMTIYIVDDCSEHGYDDVIEFFKNDLNIVSLRTPHNMGPGATRQYGLDNSNGEYVIFLDSDDQFYNAYSVQKLHCEISCKKLDMVYGKDKCEKGDIDIVNTDSLHGKIYRRSFLEKNHIRFNNTTYSEDNRFNKLVMGLSNKIGELPDCTHFYLNNFSSLTKSNSETDILLAYIENMYLALDELVSKKAKKDKISKVLCDAYVHVFWMIKTIDYRHILNKEKVYSYKYNFEKFCGKYLDSELLCEKLKYIFYEYRNIDNKEILRIFNEFRRNFVAKKSFIDIIIPAHNVHHMISDALFSILSQKVSDCVRVYIANYKSVKNYQKEVDRFKKYLDIVEINVPNDCDPIQYGIENSNSEYFTILEPTDMFNDYCSLYYLKNLIQTVKGAEISTGYVSIESDNEFFKYEQFNTVYGCLYSRKILKKYNFNFDMNINIVNVILRMVAKIAYSSELVYVGREDEFVDRNLKDFNLVRNIEEFENYAKSTLDVINHAIKIDSSTLVYYNNKKLSINFDSFLF